MATILILSDSLVTAKSPTVTRTIAEVQSQLSLSHSFQFDALNHFNSNLKAQNQFTIATLEQFTRLKQRIRAMSPDVILLFGDQLSDLFFSQSIDSIHNLIKYFDSIPVICTYHPSTLFRQHNDSFDPNEDGTSDDWPFWFSKSIEKSIRLASDRSLLTKERKLMIGNTLTEVSQFIENNNSNRLVCMDIETTYTDHTLRSIALTFDGHTACCVSQEDSDPLVWDTWFAYCRSIFESTEYEIIGHYFTSFDANVLNRKHGWQLKALVWNSHTVQNLINPETPKSLLDLARIHLFVSDWKGGATSAGPQLREYNCTDVINNFHCYQSQLASLTSLPSLIPFSTTPAFPNLLAYFRTIVQPMEQIAFLTQSNGIRVDIEERQKMIEKLETEIRRLTSELSVFFLATCPTQHVQEHDTRFSFDPSLLPPAKKLTTPLVKKLFGDRCYVVSAKMATEFGFVAGEVREKFMGHKLSPNNIKLHFQKTGVKIPKTKTGKGERAESTGEKALKQILYRKNEKPETRRFIELVLLLREYSKFHGTYAAKPLDTFPDGISRWRSVNVVGGTKTERSASKGMMIGSHPIVNKKTRRITSYEPITVGGSIQQFPRADSSSLFAFQSIFIPPTPDHSWLSFDWSAAEAYVGCWLTEDWAKEKKMLDGFDIHTETASLNVGFDISPLKQSNPKQFKKYRQAAGKTFNYSGYYGSTYKTMFEQFQKDGIDVSLAEVQSWWLRFHQTNPQIVQFFHQRIQRQLKSTRTLSSYLGRRRFFLKPLKITNHRGELVDNENLFREGYNYIPQSTVGGMTHLVAARCLKEMPQLTIICEKHDQLIGFVETDKLDQSTTQLKSILESITVPVISTNGEQLEKRIPFEISSGYRWSDL